MPEKRRRAGAEVRDGQAVSLSLPLATRPAPDNPTPVTHLMIQTGARGESGGDDVAAACAARSRWTFLCAIAPLVLIRGTTSQVNPLAIF